ncbi:MAG: hypothetical protein KDH96_02815 [Candidatus Riesia sp.]|nr:hypothetical protein [Candidatus Riesia sp.]
MFISRDLFDKIESRLLDFDIKVHEEYSGRGMYGKNCIGFSFCDTVPYFCYHFQEEIMQILDYCNEDEREMLDELYHCFLEGAEQDSLGMGTIVYNRRFSIMAEE